MPVITSISAINTRYAAPSYPRSNEEAAAMGLRGTRNKEMRALTIAAFRLAQNNSQLSTRPMNSDLLFHLLAGSTTALSYWEEKGRLTQVEGGFALTPDGLAECQDTLLGRAGAYSTTEANVQEWVTRMVHGDHVAQRARTFPQSAWQQ
jgi:predicted cupin superfamily sugar epimerase